MTLPARVAAVRPSRHAARLAKPARTRQPFLLAIADKEDRLMDTASKPLTPAAELARANPVRIRNESAEYRAARTALLAEEIELRRHIERVAAQRRALPPGGAVS